MFSVGDHRTGRFVSALTPFSVGPRHCGQFSARTTPNVAETTITVAMRRFAA
jgi:hypothetical protein